MELIATPIGLVTLVLLALAYLYFAPRLPFGAVSLPCMTFLISIIYFFLMPALALADRDTGFFGMYLTSLEWSHFAVLLYAAGATLAFLRSRRVLAENPAAPRALEYQMSLFVLWSLGAMALAALTAQVALGRLNLLASESYMFAEDVSDLAFINLFFTMMIPLTLVVLIRDDFGPRSLFLLIVVLGIFLQVAFRYRLMILLFAVVASFMQIRRLKMRVPLVMGGTLAALLIINIIVNTRRYGGGIDLSLLEGMSWQDILQSFGGEIGPIFAFSYTASNPLPDSAMFDPWIIGISRLVPSFLWPDKPSADYLRHVLGGFWDQTADRAGVAAPQHVEMLLQFGWFGLPILAFLYFSIACYLISRLNRLGREARIAGCAMAPAFFGFYMQTRGYFFQILSDGLFLFGPLFLLHLGNWRKVRPGAAAGHRVGAKPRPAAQPTPVRGGARTSVR